MRKKATVAIVPDKASTSAPTEADFGANDWLLEEMYEQYTADPNSVDETWAEYFKTHGAPVSGDGDGAATEKRQPQAKPAAESAAQQKEPTVAKAATATARAQTSPDAQPQEQSKEQPARSSRAPTVEKPAPTKEIRPSAP